MTDITIYDGNNWFRRRIEASQGYVLSECFDEVQYKNGIKIFVWDGFNGLQSRRDIYPEYKMNRMKASEDIYTSMNTFKELLYFTDCFSIQVNGFEADDIIAKLARKYSDQGLKVFIESNDADFAQLGLPMARQTFKVEPKWVILYKVLVGDPSDNIKGVEGFGQGAWDKLTEDQKQTLYAIINCYGNEPDKVVEEKVKDFLRPSVTKWISNQENRKLLSKYNKIINFLPVPDDLIEKNTKKGVNRPDLVYPIFKEILI